MATIKQWEDEINTLSKKDAERLEQGLTAILGWRMFRSEYNELRTLRIMLKHHLEVIQHATEYVFKP